MKAPKVSRLRFRVKCLKGYRFQVNVPSEGSEGSEVPSEGSVSSVQRVPSEGSK